MSLERGKVTDFIAPRVPIDKCLADCAKKDCHEDEYQTCGIYTLTSNLGEAPDLGLTTGAIDVDPRDFIIWFNRGLSNYIRNRSVLEEDIVSQLKKSMDIPNIEMFPNYYLLRKAEIILKHLDITRSVVLEEVAPCKYKGCPTLADWEKEAKEFLEYEKKIINPQAEAFKMKNMRHEIEQAVAKANGLTGAAFEVDQALYELEEAVKGQLDETTQVGIPFARGVRKKRRHKTKRRYKKSRRKSRIHKK